MQGALARACSAFLLAPPTHIILGIARVVKGLPDRASGKAVNGLAFHRLGQWSWLRSRDRKRKGLWVMRHRYG